MFGPSEPGRGDRLLAEFQAKMLARQASTEAPQQKRKLTRVTRWLGDWALLLAGGALVAIAFQNTAVYAAVIVALALIAASQVALWIYRNHSERD